MQDDNPMFTISLSIKREIFTILSVIILVIISQQSVAKYYTNPVKQNKLSFTTDNGLPDDYVARVLIDNAGFIWLVTNSSLVRYDGVQFKKYSLNNERIAGFYRSFSGDSIYVQTLTLANYTIYNGKIESNKWIKNYENMIYMQGRIAFSLNPQTKKGIDYLKVKTKNKDALFSTIHQYFLPITDTSFYCRLPDGTFLFFNGTRFSKVGKFTPTLDPIIFISQNALYYLEKDKQQAWKTTGKNFIPIHVEQKLWTILNSRQSIWRKNEYFFLSGKKCYRFQEKNQSIELVEYFSDDQTTQINDFQYSDKLNALFVATANGFRILSTKHFEHVTFERGNNIIRSFIELKPNGWVVPGNFYSGNATMRIPAERIDPFALFVDNDHNLFYSLNQHLYRYNSITKNNSLVDSVYGSLTHMTYDLHKNLFFSDQFEIYKYTSKAIKPYYSTQKDNAIIFKFMFYDDNNLLIATSKGLIATDRKNERYLLKGFEVRELFNDSAFIFVCTYGKGAFLINKSNQHLVKLPIDKNECLKYPHSILLDKNGFFWISTNNGIVRIQRKSLIHFMNDTTHSFKMYAYNKNDGLETLELNGGNSPCAAISGDYFYFASMKGIVKFNPYKTPLPHDSSIVTIEDVIADGLSYKNLNNTYTLPSNTKQIKFVVASPSVLNAQNSEIRYRIKELDSNWITLNSSMEITFLGLPNGHYDLEVRKELASYTNSYANIQVSFNIDLYYYQTWWFKILMGLLIGLIVLLVVIARSVYLKRQNILLNKKVRDQTHRLTRINQQNDVLISVLAHDIRSPIKSMEFLTNCIQHEHPDDTNLLSLTSTLLQSIKKIDIYSTNHLTWYSILKGSIEFETRLINIADLIEEVIRFHAVTIEKNGIILHKIIPEKIIVNSNYNGLFTVLTNLIDNAIKYSFDRKIRIQLLEEHDDVRIRISNPIHPDYIDGFKENIEYVSTVNWELEDPNITKKLGMRIVSFINYKLEFGLKYEITTDHHVVVSIKVPKPN